MEQNQKTQLELLAFCAALTVDALHIPKRQEQSSQVDVLAGALKLDMRQYWQPTAANYFGRIPKKFLLEAVTEAKGQPRAEALQRGWSKKDALAAACEKELADSAWLPAILCGHEGKN
jgi:ParB family chromosome partitioning protein